MANSADKAKEWIERLASHPAIPFGALLRESFSAGKLTRICDCGCNSFDIEVPASAKVGRIVEPAPDQKGHGLVFEIVFDTEKEDPSQLACLFFADARGYLSSVEITGGWSNHAPVPDAIELRSVHFVDSKLANALQPPVVERHLPCATRLRARAKTGTLERIPMPAASAVHAPITFVAALPSDFEALVAIRIEAMRESLERLGRFDPVRARARFRSGFSAEHTRHIVVDGERVGFVVLKHQGHEFLLDHLYVKQSSQSQGIGAAVLAQVFAEADAMSLPVRVGALRESASNRFYSRHGFQLVERGEFDNYYVRPIQNAF